MYRRPWVNLCKIRSARKNKKTHTHHGAEGDLGEKAAGCAITLVHGCSLASPRLLKPAGVPPTRQSLDGDRLPVLLVAEQWRRAGRSGITAAKAAATAVAVLRRKRHLAAAAAAVVVAVVVVVVCVPASAPVEPLFVVHVPPQLDVLAGVKIVDLHARRPADEGT